MSSADQTGSPSAPPGAAPAAGGGGAFWARLGVASALVLAIAAVHGISVINGFFIDDWHHALQFGRLSWSLSDLWRGFEFDYTGDILPTWFIEQPVKTVYCRPVTLALHKAAFAVFGLEAPLHHLINLFFHLTASSLAYLLAREWFGRRDTALWAGLVFAIHPATALPAQWCGVAAEPMTATWSLSSLLLMVRAVRRGPGAGQWRWLLSYLCCALALMSRESAVMLPFAVLLAGVWGSPACRAARPALLRFAPYFALAGAYFVTRTLILGGFPTPPPPYYTQPGDPNFLFQISCKFLCNLSGLALAFPPMPMFSEALLREYRWVWAVLGGGTLLVAWAMYRNLRAVPGVAFWALWILLFTASTLPMFVSPHYLYLPTLGWAMLGGTMCTRALDSFPSPGRQLVWRFGSIVILGFYGALCFTEGLILRGAWTPGQVSLQDAVSRPGGYPPNAKLFFINLSPLAHQELQGIRLTLNRPDIKGWVLTFAPDLMGPRGDLRLRRIDTHTIEVSSEQAYFSERLGRVLLQLAARKKPLTAGELIVLDKARFPFDVRVGRTGPAGVYSFQFRFEKPLDSEDYVFLLGTDERMMAPIDLRAVAGPEPADVR